MKVIFDYVMAICGVIFLAPLLVIVAILIKLTSKGNVFYTQGRIGRYGKTFTIIKFRSMTVDHGDSNTVTVGGDIRITKFGAFMRKYKLDELPELLNILKGDMSFVGPRPDLPGYADNLKGEDRKILNLRPGITGVASLKYANEEKILSAQKDPIKFHDEVIYPDKVKLNLDYYYNNNVWVDIKIIFATIFRVSY
jgi:lipopolysaccharide/colanic/teichoic acid biosynthesis glycosyltransferase